MTGPNPTIREATGPVAAGETAAPSPAAPEPAPGKKMLPASTQSCAATAMRKSAKSFVMHDFSGSTRTVASRRSAVFSPQNPERIAMAKASYERLPAPRLTDIDFCAWLSQAGPGDRLEYHRGALGFDRLQVIGGLEKRERDRLGALASCALRAAEQRLVHLVQGRLGPCRFVYIAIARPKSKAAEASLSALLLEGEPA